MTITGRPYLSSPARWLVLKSLAEATEPLDRRQLAERAGVGLTNVREVLVRPIRAGWVTAAHESPHMPRGRRYMYEITDLGRKILTDHLAEEPT